MGLRGRPSTRCLFMARGATLEGIEAAASRKAAGGVTKADHGDLLGAGPAQAARRNGHTAADALLLFAAAGAADPKITSRCS